MLLRVGDPGDGAELCPGPDCGEAEAIARPGSGVECLARSSQDGGRTEDRCSSAWANALADSG